VPTPEVSIVVPTRDRPDALGRCLAALECQDGCGPFEVVVVDDGSREPERIAQAVARSPQARLVRLSGRGPAAARNAGARAARAPVLCFTDDDCEPRPDWARRLVAALRAGGAEVVGGVSIDPRGQDHPQLLAMRAMSEAFLEEGGGQIAFLGTLNLACRAELVRDVPFDERFPFASEDRDWALRLKARGYRLARAPAAIVVHARDDGLAGFWRRNLRYGEGAYVFRQIHSGGRPSRPRFYASMLRHGFRRGPRVGLLVVVSQLATAVGFAKAARADRRARRAAGGRRDGGAQVN
jgi:glycosyltransferase involved in cell wall biosynthesis